MLLKGITENQWLVIQRSVWPFSVSVNNLFCETLSLSSERQTFNLIYLHHSSVIKMNHHSRVSLNICSLLDRFSVICGHAFVIYYYTVYIHSQKWDVCWTLKNEDNSLHVFFFLLFFWLFCVIICVIK